MTMIKKLTPVRCPCGQCDTWGFQEGTFYQGTGFDRATAEEIARRFNLHGDANRAVGAWLDEMAEGERTAVRSEGAERDPVKLVVNVLRGAAARARTGAWRRFMPCQD